MVEIREMQIDDLENVLAIEKENFSVPWDANGFFSFMIREGTAFLVAEENGKILGYAGLISAADEGDITNVSVSKTRRQKGIGNSLLEGLLDKARSFELKKIFLEVRASNEAAVRLYEKKLFQQVGVRKGYYTEPVEDALLMCKEL